MKRSKCEECGGKIARKKISYDYLGQHIGKFPAEVCTSCGEVVFDEAASDKIEIVIKQRSLYGLASTTKVAVAGSSLVIRISKKLARFLDIEKGDEVEIYPDGKRRAVIEMTR